MFRHLFFALFIFSLLISSDSLAADDVKKKRQDLVTLSAGWFDATQRDNEAAEFRVEYRFDKPFLYLEPLIGMMATTDESWYAYFGVLYDWEIGDNWYIAPNFAVGFYDDNDGKDLGLWLEFRSGIEAGYKWDSGYRLGASFSHMSNASLGSDNPGQESVMLNFSIPADNFIR